MINTQLKTLKIVLAMAFSALGSLNSAHADITQTHGVRIGDRIVRFAPSMDIAKSPPPSLAIIAPTPALGPAPQDFPVVPEFSTDAKGRVGFNISISKGTSLYGTGEVPGPLLRNGRSTTLWNTDAYGYDEKSPSLYQSHPWVLAVRPDGSAFGVLADTAWRTRINLTDGIHFISDGPAYPVIIIDRDSPQEVLIALGDLVGRMEMPPKWAIGYHQCRYSYYPDSRVRDIASEFRNRKIPCDVIWLDIHYMDEYRIFTFDSDRFPDPKTLNDDLHNQSFHTVWMIDPGVKAEPGFSVYDSGTEIDAWVRTAEGEVYQGEVWPGWCVFPDFTRADVRAWWADLYTDFIAQGIDGVWNDMNEPAVFNVKTKTMPVDNRHEADEDLGGPGPHAQYHNVYGQLMVQATKKGVMRAQPGRRPFVLSRDAFIGGQRFGAAWTGDNTANWHDLEASIPMVLNLGLSGQPFAGPDIGGFGGDGDAQMFARWMGFGAMFPFARAHTAVQNRDKEPWMFGAEVEVTSRQAIERRYELLPYYYTLFHEASINGLPIARPVFFADPADPALRSEDDSFLLGDGLLISAQVTKNADRAPVMPKGIWRKLLLSGSTNPDLPTLYIKGGSIIPTGPIMQHVSEIADPPLTLIVSLDKSGHAQGTLYEDAGDGFEYLEGQYRMTRFIAKKAGDVITIQVIVEHDGLSNSIKDQPLTVRVRMDHEQPDAVGVGTRGEGVKIDLSRIPRPN